MEDAERLRTYLKMIREGLEGLERLLEPGGEPGPDPYLRRRELLEHIYLREGVERGEFMKELREAGTTYQWIGQQVKKGYLAVTPLPSGKVRYTVTPKAVKELELGRKQRAEETEAPVLSDVEGYTALAESASGGFAEDWNSPEDAVYDRL